MEKLLAVAFLVVATTTLAQNADLTLTSDQVKKIDVTVPSDQVEKICESYNKGKESESLPISILNSIDADKVARSLWSVFESCAACNHVSFPLPRSVLQYMTKENGVRSALTFGLEDDYFSKLKYRLNDYFSRNETLAQPTLEEIVWNLYRYVTHLD